MRTYSIDRIGDLLAVPADRREACMRDILLALDLLELAAGDNQAEITAPIQWTDDDDPRINLDLGYDTLTLECTR